MHMCMRMSVCVCVCVCCPAQVEARLALVELAYSTGLAGLGAHTHAWLLGLLRPVCVRVRACACGRAGVRGGLVHIIGNFCMHIVYAYK